MAGPTSKAPDFKVSQMAAHRAGVATLSQPRLLEWCGSCTSCLALPALTSLRLADDLRTSYPGFDMGTLHAAQP